VASVLHTYRLRKETLGPASKSPKVGGEEATRRSFFCKPSGRNIRLLKKRTNGPNNYNNNNNFKYNKYERERAEK
jgi:hypothetical protein